MCSADVGRRPLVGRRLRDQPSHAAARPGQAPTTSSSTSPAAVDARRPIDHARDRALRNADEFHAITPDLAIAPAVSVVVPTLNEAANIPHVFETIPDWVYEVILVDGHSTDGTVAVAQAAASRREGHPPGRDRQRERDGSRLRRGDRRHHRPHRRRRLDRRQRDAELRERSGGRSRLRQGVPLRPRRREQRHHLAEAAREPAARRARQPHLRHPLHRPLLWLQRVLGEAP